MVTEHEVEIPVPGDVVNATWIVPEGSRGVVAFAHGSANDRLVGRSQAVAHELHSAGLATLLVDLLTPSEARLGDEAAELRFNIPLLARRLVASIDWLHTWLKSADERGLPLGLFGASTGAAAALVAAAERPGVVRAVVSRGGRPDLGGLDLRRVLAPTLLIVGARDAIVAGLNERALPLLGPRGQLELVPNASHLFTEPGAIERVAELARAWFERQMSDDVVKLPQPAA